MKCESTYSSLQCVGEFPMYNAIIHFSSICQKQKVRLEVNFRNKKILELTAGDRNKILSTGL